MLDNNRARLSRNVRTWTFMLQIFQLELLSSLCLILSFYVCLISCFPRLQATFECLSPLITCLPFQFFSISFCDAFIDCGVWIYWCLNEFLFIFHMLLMCQMSFLSIRINQVQHVVSVRVIVFIKIQCSFVNRMNYIGLLWPFTNVKMQEACGIV